MLAAAFVRRLIVLAAASVLALTAAGARDAHAAGLGCAVASPFEQPFLRWLDPLRYELVPGGDFERGAAGWSLAGGARVVNGNEPYYVSGHGTHSLSLPAGSSATSPPVCVGLDRSVLRLFSQGGGLFSALRVQLVYRTALGVEVTHDTLPVLPSSSWRPTLPLPVLANVTGLLALGGPTTEVRLRFTALGGDFRIDDVYVDPWIEN